MICPQLVDSGVYVLGALPPAQRMAYERHLTDCAECRAEVGDLAVLPGLLGRLDEAAVASFMSEVAPPSVLAGALIQVRRQRRTRRVAAIAVAAAVACAALVAGLIIPQPTGRPSAVGPSVITPVTSTPPSPSITPSVVLHEMSPIGPPGPVTARVALLPVAKGTQIQLKCWYSWDSHVPYTGDSATFSLYAIPRNGLPPAKLRTWTAEPGDVLSLPALSQWPLRNVARLELRDADGKTILQYIVT